MRRPCATGATARPRAPTPGRSGKVLIKVWPSATAPGVNNPTTTSDPTSVKLATGQLITVGFVPAGATLPKPSATTITTMLQPISTAGSTTTTAVAATVSVTRPDADGDHQRPTVAPDTSTTSRRRAAR